MTLDHATQRELLDLLVPFLNSEGERRALLTHALGEDCPALQRIEWGGSAETFVLRMVEALVGFGEVAPGSQALWKLLETVRERVEVDRKARIGALKPIVNRPIARAEQILPIGSRALVLQDPGSVRGSQCHLPCTCACSWPRPETSRTSAQLPFRCSTSFHTTRYCAGE